MSQSHGGADDQATTSIPSATPRWVKLFAIGVAVVVLLIIIMFTIGGEHGPGRHMPSGDAGSSTVLVAHRVQPQ